MRASDHRFMRLAISLGKKGIGLASPNPPVGCVIVRDGQVIGRGWHDYSAVAHAETVALREAGRPARGATAYVTLEPCSHQGRTPPCARALVDAGIRRVCAAMTDPSAKVAGRGLDYLRFRGVEVQAGLLAEEAAPLIEPFACHSRTGRPLVVAKAGMSLDGRIATAVKAGVRITGEEANRLTHSLRLQMDAILVGIETVLSDDPELTYRGDEPKGRPLLRVVLDSRLRMPAGCRLAKGASEGPVIVFCGTAAPAAGRRRLEKAGVEVIPVGKRRGRLDPLRILKVLGQRDVLGLLVEGGGEIHWSFLEERLVDKFYFMIAPVILGGGKATSAVGGKGYPRIESAPRFAISRVSKLGSDLVLEAYPSYSKSILSPWQASGVPPSVGQGSSQSSATR